MARRGVRGAGALAVAGIVALVGCRAEDEAGAPATAPVATVAPVTDLASTVAEPATTAATAPPATPAPTPAATAPPTVPVDLPCPTTTAEVVGIVPDVLPELSGLAESRGRPDVLWAHNDSGDRARLFGVLHPDGTLVSELHVDELALDWEDVATTTTADGTPVVWVADTGDNLHLRLGGVLVRVPEPPGADWPAGVDVNDATIVNITYSDGRRPDVESLLVDPATGDLVLVAKDVDVAADGRRTAAVYRVRADDVDDGRAAAERVGEIDVPDEAYGPTGADAAANGSLVVVRTPSTALVWPSVPGVSVIDRWRQTPDAPCRIDLVPGEAVAVSADGRQLTVASEGAGTDIVRIALG